ncbi:MAG: hypothetical protein HDT27_00780 [Subdoligranulum sp.]|nr:hypothetical protein [Subdoligranulum sp.]
MIRVLLQCDDAYFVRAFNGFASTYCRDMEFECFTDPQKARDSLAAKASSFDAVLGTQEFLSSVNPKNAIKLQAAEKTVYSDADGMSINIYQSGPVIISDLKNAMRLQGKAGLGPNDGGGKYIVSCFSAQGGGGKTTVCYALALAAARKGKNALYINFEPFPYEGQLEEHTFTASVDDLLFALKDERPLSLIAADTVERSRAGVLRLPPFHSAGDLLSLSREQIGVFLQALIEANELDYAFIDLPAGFQALNLWVMEESTHVLQVYSDNAPGRGRIGLLSQDPYYQNLPIRGSSLLVLNQCADKNEEDGIDGKIPYSHSLQSGIPIAEVQEKNPSFLESCMKLLEKIV